MSDNKDDHIRSRAHDMWEKEGRPEGRHVEHWTAAEQEFGGAKGQVNEGEGSRAGARAYNEHVQETIASGKVEEKAKEAEAALEGAEAPELKRAEAAGRKRSKGEDPALSR